MSYLQQKYDLLLKFKENEKIIEELIEESNFDYVLKRLDQNGFLIRQIEELDTKYSRSDVDQGLLKKVDVLVQELKVLHKKNIDFLTMHREGFKSEALKANNTKKPLRAYTSNLR